MGLCFDHHFCARECAECLSCAASAQLFSCSFPVWKPLTRFTWPGGLTERSMYSEVWGWNHQRLRGFKDRQGFK